MAMKVMLRNKAGGDVGSYDLKGDRDAFPDIVTLENYSYILRRVMPDKKSAYYYEATIVGLPEP